jgi:assimilatory nitrite reductase (NAD(P)H) large subunit precursor (EC 1.7.1.4)
MKLLVIGNGMAGQRFLEYVTGESKDFDITVLCEEPRPAYDRVGLTSFFSGKSAKDLALVEPEFFDSNGITLHLNEKACRSIAPRSV